MQELRLDEMERVPDVGYQWTARMPLNRGHFLRMWLNFLIGRKPCIIVELVITDEYLKDYLKSRRPQK